MSAELGAWLDALGLGRYTAVFADNGVDFDALHLLSDSDLQGLGVLLGHRRKLMRAVAETGRAVAPPPGGAEPQATPSPQAAAEPQAAPTPQAEGERRQVTVLFCDMVGFTELANRVDPEVLQGITRAYEDTCAVCITRYEGYVFQRLGDGIVAFFGFPLAHEGEAERAIRAGLEIIDALARLEVPDAGRLAVRIGIATGLVVVTGKGAVGETMNVAARLQAIARPGTLVVSERVQRLAAGSFDYEDLGLFNLKGIPQPNRALRVLGVSEAASRFEAATQEGVAPLVGRELEIGLLLDRWAHASEGEGQVVLLSGEPGIGKSRILVALRERLVAQGAGVHRLQCSPYYVNSAFYPLIDSLERTLGFARGESPQSKLDKLEAFLVNQFGRPLADVRFLASILSIPCEDRYGPLALTPQKLKDETLRSLVDLIEAGAHRLPRLMLFEDLHWADATTLEVLSLLIDRVPTLPLLVVLTHRPEFKSRWAELGHVSALNLSKLSRAQSAAIVSRLAGGKALPAALYEQILAKTEGIPLFVEELTKSILESGMLEEAADRFEYGSGVQTFTIPATLRDSLMARLDRFMPVKEIAQIGSAIGREFSYELIAAVSPMRPPQLDAALAQLTESGLAFRRGTPPDAVYTFKHALVQDAAYDSLLRSRRQELHGRIARVIQKRFASLQDTEPEVLAHHLTSAGLANAAIPLWQSAGERALKRMALREALSHLGKGLELTGTLAASAERDAGELDLRTLLGTAWLALKGWAAPEVWTSLHPAIALAKSLDRNDALLPTLFGLWVNVLTQGRVAESLERAEQLLDTGVTRADPQMQMYGHLAVLGSNLFLGRLVTARAHFDHVLALYDEDKHRYLADIFNHDPRTMASVYATHAIWMLGYPDQAARLSDAKDAHALRRGHPFDRSWALCWGAGAYDYRGEPDTLREHAEEAERLGREHSMPFVWGCLAPLQYGAALIHKGRYAEGLALLTPALVTFTANGCRVSNPSYECQIAEATARLGNLDAALAIIDAALAQVEHPGWEERVHCAEILRVKGWILSLRGDAAGAEQHFLDSLDWARRQQAKSWELRSATSLARLWQSQGRGAQARELLAPIYAWFTEGFDTRDLRDAKALLEELEARA